jgi:hypothetical protein
MKSRQGAVNFTAALIVGVLCLLPSHNARGYLDENPDTGRCVAHPEESAAATTQVEGAIPREFLEKIASTSSRAAVQSLFTEDDLEALYEVLKRVEYAHVWKCAAFAIGALEPRAESLEALLQYIARDDTGIEILKAKPSGVWAMHMWSADFVGPTLVPLVTREGATELLSQWDKNKFTAAALRNAISRVREFAASALALKENATYFKVVEEEYERIMQKDRNSESEPENLIVRKFAEALGVRDAIADLGHDGYLEAIHGKSVLEVWMVMAPYTRPYLPKKLGSRVNSNRKAKAKLELSVLGEQ